MVRYRPKWRQRREEYRPKVNEDEVPKLIAQHQTEWIEKQAQRQLAKLLKQRKRNVKKQKIMPNPAFPGNGPIRAVHYTKGFVAKKNRPLNGRRTSESQRKHR